MFNRITTWPEHLTSKPLRVAMLGLMLGIQGQVPGILLWSISSAPADIFLDFLN